MTQATNRSRRQTGSALLVSMMIMALMGVLALASLDTVMRDRQVAGFQNRGQTALYAAEAGVSAATGLIRQSGPDPSLGVPGLQGFNPAFPTDAAPRQLGGGTASDPSFYAEPGEQAIRYLDSGDNCWSGNVAGAMSQNIGTSNPIWRDALWDVRVQGQTQDGTASTIQAVVTSCFPFST